MLNFYVISVCKYGSENETIFSPMKRRLDAKERWFYRRTLRNHWTEWISNEEVYSKIITEKTQYKKEPA